MSCVLASNARQAKSRLPCVWKLPPTCYINHLSCECWPECWLAQSRPGQHSPSQVRCATETPDSLHCQNFWRRLFPRIIIIFAFTGLFIINQHDTPKFYFKKFLILCEFLFHTNYFYFPIREGQTVEEGTHCSNTIASYLWPQWYNM